MKTIEQPDGGAILLFDEGPVPFKAADGRMMHISLDDAHEMLETLTGILAVADDPSSEGEAVQHLRRNRGHLVEQISILTVAICEAE